MPAAAIGVGHEVAHALELKIFAGLALCREFLHIAVGEHMEAVGIEQFVEEIDPVTKAVVVIGALVAFVFGFFWRRRQYLKDKKNNKR